VKKITRIKNGKNREVISQLGRLDPTKDWKVTIEEDDYIRSNDQNKLYWDLLSDIGKHLGYNSNEMHQLMAYKFLSYQNSIMDMEVTAIPSTTKLTVKEFSKYINNIQGFAASLGFVGTSHVVDNKYTDFQDFQDG